MYALRICLDEAGPKHTQTTQQIPVIARPVMVDYAAVVQKKMAPCSFSNAIAPNTFNNSFITRKAASRMYCATNKKPRKPCMYSEAAQLVQFGVNGCVLLIPYDCSQEAIAVAPSASSQGAEFDRFLPAVRVRYRDQPQRVLDCRKQTPMHREPGQAPIAGSVSARFRCLCRLDATPTIYAQGHEIQRYRGYQTAHQGPCARAGEQHVLRSWIGIVRLFLSYDEQMFR